MSVYEFKVPQLGLTVESVTIVEWFKGVGDRVEVGEEILEVDTDKTTNAIESPVSGVLTKILLAVDDEAAVGDLMALIEQDE